MQTDVACVLRCIAGDVEAMGARNADANLEKRQLEEIRQKFIENLKRDPMLKDLDADKMWAEVRESVRRDLRRRPFDWRN